MMLSKDFYCEMIVVNINIGMVPDGLYQACLYFGAGAVFVVQNPKFGMAAFPVQVKISFFVFIEIYTPADQLLDLRRSFFHHALHHAGITQSRPRIEGVGNVFFEIVPRICYRCNTALCIVGVGIFERCFGYYGHLAVFCHFQGVTHPRNARPND
ncbi:hypothetical protein SDC9_186324 [bioreactor metagenome]|uniref:Uncharacterized protein n=1 Tax=bioreactor metagenome TaxID=1076179 RepID=A0A645HKQ6_9ZZZZ